MPQEATEPSGSESADRGKALGVQILYPTDPLRIAHIHFVKFSQLGGEILMDVGILDDQAAIARINDRGGAEAEPVKAYVTDRYAMSPNTFATIKGNLEELWGKMKAAGTLTQLGLE
jgi:hypothetical protein